MRIARGELKAARTPFRIKAVGYGNSFEQRRLACPVFADEIGNLGVQGQRVQIPNRWNCKWVNVERFDPFSPQCDVDNVRLVGHGRK